MSFFDWNGDGKKDMMDDFIEYKSYEDFNKNNNNNNYRGGGGMSNFNAGCATVISIFIAAAILSVFNLDGIVLVIAFIIVASIVAAIVSTFFE